MVADAAKETADAAKEVGSSMLGGAWKATKWGVNQLHPFGENGRLGRTLIITTIFAGIGAAAAPALAAGSTATAAGTAAAGSVTTTTGAMTAAPTTFWGSMGAGAKGYLSTAWDGVTASVDFIGDQPWGEMVSNVTGSLGASSSAGLTQTSTMNMGTSLGTGAGTATNVVANAPVFGP